jgi:hypothetical protein
MHRQEVQAMRYRTGADKQGSRVSLFFCYERGVSEPLLVRISGNVRFPRKT